MARLLSARTLVLGGLAVAAAAGALKNRSKVAGLLGRSTGPEPYPAPSEAPVGARAAEPGPAPAPPIANADAAGPPENTATHVPAPDPYVHDPAGGIDEVAEEEAAAAEAANIGGPAPEYAGEELGEPASEADRPLEEAGEGVAEGYEQADADLVENAAPTAGDPDPAERQIEDTIAAQDNRFEGETPDDVIPASDPVVPDAAAPDPAEVVLGVEPPSGTTDESPETSAAEKGSNVWRSEPNPEDQPTVEQAKVSKQDDKPDDDDGSEWQTWSGRAVEP